MSVAYRFGLELLVKQGSGLAKLLKKGLGLISLQVAPFFDDGWNLAANGAY